MRPFRAGVVVLALAAAIAGCGGDEEGGGGSLIVAGWGGAYDQATKEHYADPFQAAGGPAVRFVDAPGTQAARIEAQKKAGRIEWDMIDSVAGAEGYVLFDKGHLAPLPADLKAKFKQVLDPEKVSDFGFTMGNLGNVIVCNMEKMKTCPKDMAEFFDTDKFPQVRMMGGIGPIQSATIGMVASGTPPSETGTTPVDMDKAFAKLDQVKSKVKVFWESGDQQEQAMRSGEVDMGIMWTGRAFRLKSGGMNLKVNWAGGSYESGMWTVVKGAPNEKAAFEFLEWIADHPEEQAKWAQKLDYSVPNPKAFDLMPEREAAQLVDNPENFKQLAVPNYKWYVEHASELNARFQDYLKG